MKAHSWDKDTLLYVGSRDLREDVLNGGYLPLKDLETTDDLPKTKANQAIQRKNGKWVLIPDFRSGEYWDKTTREKKSLTEAGIKPPSSWTEKRPTSPFEIFDDSTGEWKFSVDLYKQQALQLLSSLCFAKRNEIFPDYKVVNILSGIEYHDSDYTLKNYKLTASRFREIYYSLKQEIENATVKEDIDEKISNVRELFPISIITK